MEVLLSYHRHLVEGLIVVLLINTILPHTTIKKGLRHMILYSRIGFFLFWAVWSMVLFSGLVTLVFSRMSMSFSIWSMLIVTVILPILDSFRVIHLYRDYWLEELDGISFSNLITILELIIVLITFVLVLR